jgi:S-adenosylmethionine-diacylglycerol 3-amino-3-carboxypropyl transferase
MDTVIETPPRAPLRVPSASEVAGRADFSQIRYAQCWEDADILLEALNIRPGEVCLSIGSAGDNALSLLTCQPERVVVIDLNPSQLACLELRVAAYRELDHEGLLELMGSRPSGRRAALYQRCRCHLAASACDFWDARPQEIADRKAHV